MATRISGRIIALTVARQEVIIGLDNDPAQGPKDNVLHLLNADHANFNALYSLALAAASNRWPVTIRIAGDGQISQAEVANVSRLAVGWRADDLDLD
jgi:hypothetical protein